MEIVKRNLSTLSSGLMIGHACVILRHDLTVCGNPHATELIVKTLSSLRFPLNIDLSRPGQVRDLLCRNDFRPSAVLGQNFLIDRNILDRMLDASGVAASEHVLEIGPGLGVLTAPLLERAGRLTAVEKDARLYAWLCERFGDCPHAVFVLGDYLKEAARDPDLLTADAVVSNLPYAVAARILVLLALGENPPQRMLVTVQREVGQRLTAAPGTAAYGLLTVLVGDGYRAEFLRKLSPSCFYPVPAVWSAVIRLQRRSRPASPRRPSVWLPLLRYAFSRRRKQMIGILTTGPWTQPPDRREAAAWLQSSGIDPSARPEDVGIESWRYLAQQCEGWVSAPADTSP